MFTQKKKNRNYYCWGSFHFWIIFICRLSFYLCIQVDVFIYILLFGSTKLHTMAYHYIFLYTKVSEYHIFPDYYFLFHIEFHDCSKFIISKMGCQTSINSLNIANTINQNPPKAACRSSRVILKQSIQGNSRFAAELLEAKHMQENDEYELALDLYLKLNGKQPYHYEVCEGIGTCYRMLKDYEEAIRWDLESLRMFPENQNVCNSLSISYKLQKDYVNAQFYAKRAIQINPDYSNAYYNLGNVYASLNQLQLAIKKFEKAISLSPKVTLYYKKAAQIEDRRGEFTRAISWYEKCIEIDGLDSDSFFYIGIIYKNKIKDKEKALQYLLKSIQITPTNALAHNIIGNIYLNLSRLEQAIIHFKNSIENKPNYSFPHNGLGNAYYKQKRYSQAIQSYKNSIRCDANYATPYSGLGDCYKELSDLENALKSYQNAIQLNPKDGNPYNGIGNVYRAYGQIMESIKWFEKSIEVNPDNQHPYNGLGNAYKDIKQYELALKNYGKAINLNKSNIFSYNGIGNLFKQLKDYDQAENWYRKCIQIDPKYDRAYTNLGNQYLTQGKFAESLQLFKKALQINPQSDTAYNSLGINYSKLGDHTLSIEMFKKAIYYNPCFSLAYINLSFEYIDFYNYQDAFKCLKKSKQIVDTSDRDVFSNCNGFILDQLQLFDSEMEEWQMKIRLGYLTDEDKQKIQMLRTGFENRFQSIFNVNDEGRLSVTLSDLNPQFSNLLKLIKKDAFELKDYIKLSNKVYGLYKENEDNFYILAYLFCKYFWNKRLKSSLSLSQIDKELQGKLKKLCEVHPPTSNTEELNDQISLIEIPEAEKVNLFEQVEYFEDYRYLVKEIEEINKKCAQVIPIFKEFIYKISSQNGGYHAKANLKLPHKQTQKFKVYIRIMEKMFKEVSQRKQAIIMNVQSKLKEAKVANMQSIMSCLLETWMQEINGILKERKDSKIPTKCFISDFVRGKTMFKSVKAIETAANKLIAQSELEGYTIIQIDNRLRKDTKDLVFKIKIKGIVCEYQMAIEFDDTQHHYNHCLYEIKRSPMGCIFGSFLFLSKCETLQFIKQAKQIKSYYENVRLSREEIAVKEAAEYLLAAFEEDS